MPFFLIVLFGGAGYLAYKYLVKPAPAQQGTHAAAAQPVMKSAPAPRPAPVAAAAPAPQPDAMLDTSGATQADDTAGDI